MRRYIKWLLIGCALVLFLAGCAVVVGDRTLGVDSGKFIYTDNALYGNYYYPMDVVWNACKRTLFDLRATDATYTKKIASGTMEGTASDEKIRISVEYVSKNETQVAVRIGMAGSTLGSKLIHDRIRDNLLKEGPSPAESTEKAPAVDEPPAEAKEPVKSQDLGK
ncbi:MAG TPA: DUF3568 family protein [Syntrophales bacterium]|nr:DUF3568 family protein [Syntrophales bacterium]HOX93935.1 DUF3568 family protein [Syntrophales bacterium]HPI56106.1 DUF3568 family protein [Syntrophales bacterium]HPN24004.1 DUF3568 family protein [Syntrophales bacterium]HQM28283.1 DUF3568 family protein [Syntrophales bacterium]